MRIKRWSKRFNFGFPIRTCRIIIVDGDDMYTAIVMSSSLPCYFLIVVLRNVFLSILLLKILLLTILHLNPFFLNELLITAYFSLGVRSLASNFLVILNIFLRPLLLSIFLLSILLFNPLFLNEVLITIPLHRRSPFLSIQFFLSSSNLSYE